MFKADPAYLGLILDGDVELWQPMQAANAGMHGVVGLDQDSATMLEPGFSEPRSMAGQLRLWDDWRARPGLGPADAFDQVLGWATVLRPWRDPPVKQDAGLS